MTARTSGWMNDDLVAYIAAHAQAPDEVQQWLARRTAETTGSAAGMQIGGDQAALMTLLVHLTGARRAIEVGTFTGYSSLAIARALGPEGHLLCCDVSEEWTALAREAWERAGVADRIELRIGPALDTLRSLPLEPALDLAFIDADKRSYQAYYEELLVRLRPNGLIMVDNTIWSERVLAPAEPDDHDTAALQAFNDAVAVDPRVESYLLPVGDGLTLVRKR